MRAEYLHILVTEHCLVGWMVGWIYGIPIFAGDVFLNPFYTNKQFYFQQFSKALVHSSIVKNISISRYLV